MLHQDHLWPIGYMVRMSNPSDDTNPAQRPVTRSQHTKHCPQIIQLVDPAEESDTVSSDAEFETVHNPPDFDVDEVRRQLETVNQSSGENERSESSEEDERSEEESCGIAENQPNTETKDEVQETNDEPVEEQDLEGGASLPLLNSARRDKVSKNTRSESEKSCPVRKSEKTKRNCEINLLETWLPILSTS